jgi:homoserine dehydrogenase
VNVGIIGFGTVSSGTVQILVENRDPSRGRAVGDRDQEDRGSIWTQTRESAGSSLLTKDAMEIINDLRSTSWSSSLEASEGQGLHPFVSGKRKHVVTANKALLAEHGRNLRAAEHMASALPLKRALAGNR